MMKIVHIWERTRFRLFHIFLNFLKVGLGNSRKKYSTLSQTCSRISWNLFRGILKLYNSRISPATTNLTM